MENRIHDTALTLFSSRSGFCLIYNTSLLKVDHAEQTVGVSVRACGEEQLVGVAVHSAALPESQRPKTIDADDLVARILELSHKLSSRGIECVNPAIGQVSHQQRVADRTKVLRRQRHTPGRLEVGIFGKGLDEFPSGVENIYGSLAETAVNEGHIQLVVDVLHVVHSKAGQLRIRERPHLLERSVDDVDLVIDACRQPGVPGTVSGRESDHGGARVYGRIPAANRARFEGVKDE